MQNFVAQKKQKNHRKPQQWLLEIEKTASTSEFWMVCFTLHIKMILPILNWSALCIKCWLRQFPSLRISSNWCTRYTNLSSQDTQLLKPAACSPTKCAQFSQLHWKTSLPANSWNQSQTEVPHLEQCLITLQNMKSTISWYFHARFQKQDH